MKVTPPRLLSWKQVQPLVGISRTTAWSWSKTGRFPKPRRVGGVTRYLESEILAWVIGTGAA